MITKLFLDTEFTGLRKDTTIISIGIVSDCGKSFYAEFSDYDKSQIDEWLEANVINNLLFNNTDIFFDEKINHIDVKGNKEDVSYYLKKWISNFEKVEFWSDCLAYDWVLFRNLLGDGYGCELSNMDYIPYDICTLFKMAGVDPDISREIYANVTMLDFTLNERKHNALSDARLIRMCHNKLFNYLKKS